MSANGRKSVRGKVKGETGFVCMSAEREELSAEGAEGSERGASTAAGRAGPVQRV